MKKWLAVALAMLLVLSMSAGAEAESYDLDDLTIDQLIKLRSAIDDRIADITSSNDQTESTLDSSVKMTSMSTFDDGALKSLERAKDVLGVFHSDVMEFENWAGAVPASCTVDAKFSRLTGGVFCGRMSEGTFPVRIVVRGDGANIFEEKVVFTEDGSLSLYEFEVDISGYEVISILATGGKPGIGYLTDVTLHP